MTKRIESKKARKEKLGGIVEAVLAALSDRVHPMEKNLISDSNASIRVKPEEIRRAASLLAVARCDLYMTCSTVYYQPMLFPFFQ